MIVNMTYTININVDREMRKLFTQSMQDRILILSFYLVTIAK